MEGVWGGVSVGVGGDGRWCDWCTVTCGRGVWMLQCAEGAMGGAECGERGRKERGEGELRCDAAVVSDRDSVRDEDDCKGGTTL